MIKLSKRLEHVASYVTKNSIVIDVGTDHGLLPMYLVENKIIKKAIASDVVPSKAAMPDRSYRFPPFFESIGSMRRKKKNMTTDNFDNQIIKNGFKENIKVVLSDGLKSINDKKILNEETDTVIIAGMGGILISDILKARRDYIDNKNN